MTRHLWILSAAISLPLVAACNGVTQPMGPGTKFVLVRIGGDTLPTFTGTAPGAATAIADTLVFVPVGNGMSGKVEHHQTMQTNVRYSSVYDESYEWHAGVLTFTWPPCPPNADCTANFGQSTDETGRFGPGMLTITYASPFARPRTYRRVE